MCKQQQLPTPVATPVVQDRKESPADVVFQSCGLDRSCPTSVTTPQGQGVRLDQYQSSIKRRRRRTRSSIGIVVPDHDFEWYDLDAIREADSCDFRAGLVFTSERQILNNGVEVNSINPSVVVDETTNTKDRTKDRQDNFDLFFWVNHHHGQVEETAAEKEEREFRERMEELEEEIMSHDSSSWSSTSSSLSSSFRSSSSSETKHEGDDWI